MERKNKILFVSLGCDKNLVDAEHMLGSLSFDKYEITDDEASADIIIVNTCCFIKDALDESIETILSFEDIRKKGNAKALIVTGCLAQQYREDILKELDFVDAVVGTNSYDELPAVIEEVLGGNERPTVIKSLTGIPRNAPRVISTGGFSSYLKIAEGCDKHCTYCIIPSLRGSYRSVPEDELLNEAVQLAENGVKELNIVAQDTTLYGTDLYGEKRLHILLEKLCAIEGLRWIRLLYCYPEDIYDELIEVMRREKKICHYIDMPVQHCNDDILKKMGRRTSKSDIEAVVKKLREAIPDIVLRTTLITGFPGESEEQHRELCRFVKDMRFERLGTFTYSRIEGTAAYSMEHQIDEEVKESRRDELMLIQQGISAEQNEARKGQELEVYIEGYIPEDNVYVGRSYAHAPDVDGYVFMESENRHETGDFVICSITDGLEYDLTGKEIYEPSE